MLCFERQLTYTSLAGPANPSPQTPWGVHPGPEWMPAGLTRPAELIPCEWQSQQSRWKRRDMKRTGMARPRPKSSSPPPTPPSGRTILRVGNRDLLRRYYEKAFEDFQQLNCRAIAKSYIKLVEPRKQVHYPYNGRKVISGVTQRVDPELTKPGWWPAGVLHREPDHLLKRGRCLVYSMVNESLASDPIPDRLRLLVHILCELKDSHGVTADKLRDASQDVRRQITPTNRLQVLDEIYFVRQMEERFLDGEVEANTLVQVTQTHLPEAIYQDGEELSSLPHAVPTSDPDVPDPSDEHSIPTLDEVKPHCHVQGLPLSPATSESSGPHSPTTGGFGSYSLGMAPSVLPHDISSVPKPLPTDPSYMTGYFSQSFIPPDRTSGFWPSEPHGNPGSQYGY
ncbi:hypothetical protein NUU61_000700 [Penicillium alfredii]|uniref:Subtelomeric hrmA-associated cluster protein AFUB-079030/YDR124W-like helical bundle domain-containing protein n=1 Tax=Penicillium alfredii TaxID=1506179 RepID=A0A9W9GA56_9EURO|nr:uncharacterized protein NUU61_000700 [Penicillium alfredii]KAJ5114941.1 hypothetical protein NUU61_000700 [Penicillium alfredii]